VVFLIYQLAAAPASRSNTWWDSYNLIRREGAFVSEPMVMVDSGKQAFAGSAEYETYYKNMICASARRNPQAVIHATYEQVGQYVLLEIEMKNLASQLLSFSTNAATIHVIVYVEKSPGILTSNVLATYSTPLQHLELNQSATITLTIPIPNGKDASSLKYLVLLDYVPPEAKGAHDMLQATKAVKK
jgi:hypothetical protein